MFTGLIEKTTKVVSFSENTDGANIQIENVFPDEIELGDSIALNGVCLTVNEISGNILTFNVSRESLSSTNIRNLKNGSILNLERAMCNNSRFDGHLVYGHVDGVASVYNIKNDGFSYQFCFKCEKDILRYIVKKGSVAINGISLTVANTNDITFTAEIIPHTYKNTNLSSLKKGDIVNIETDIISKYIEKFLYLDKNDSKISMEMLKDNGFF